MFFYFMWFSVMFMLTEALASLNTILLDKNAVLGHSGAALLVALATKKFYSSELCSKIYLSYLIFGHVNQTVYCITMLLKVCLLL